MKKIFTLIALAVLSLTAVAKDYQGDLSISLDGSTPTSSKTTISVETSSEDVNAYDIVLKNFSFGTTKIGDVTITGVKEWNKGLVNGYTFLSPITKDAAITNGGLIAIVLGKKVTVTINGGSCMYSDKLYLDIHLPVKLYGKTINVDATFGDEPDYIKGFQIPNSDFEAFHKASVEIEGGEKAESDEPNSWHSFMSASGEHALIYMAGYNPHTFISNDVRPGSTGKTSVKLLALDMWIAIANGTMTTGRINTGSTTATETDKNYAWSDMSKTDLDPNGDPFYAVMNGKPDSLKVWVKFGQGTPNAEHPYATVNAVINDGTEYHDPEDSTTTYTNVVAKATNNKIESTNGEWKELTIPFDYDSYKQNGAEVKSILVTISTNADAGQGSDKDTLLVDDLSLIYNAGIKSINVKGTEAVLNEGEGIYEANAAGNITANDIEVVSDGKGAYVSKELETVDGGVKATITVTSNDLKTTNVYTLNIKGATTGINNIQAEKNNAAEGIYNIDGQKVSNANQPGLYIIKNADGKTVKVIKK